VGELPGFYLAGYYMYVFFSLVVLCYFLFDPDARLAFTKNAPSLVEF
jgi:hypothetical protein